MIKRKALTINRLALGSLRTHGRQYIALTLGIVLAIFFASGMLLMGGSMIHTLREQHNQRVGSQDVALLDAEQVKMCIRDRRCADRHSGHLGGVGAKADPKRAVWAMEPGAEDRACLLYTSFDGFVLQYGSGYT